MGAFQRLSKPSLQWKQRLIIGLKAIREIVVSDGELVYTLNKCEKGVGFTCTVASKYFNTEYTCGKQPSHVKATEAASKIAFSREFPSIFSALPPEVVKGIAPTVDADPKAELQKQWSRLLGRATSKEDIVYSFEESGEYIVPSVTLGGLDAPQSFTAPKFKGSEKEKKKQAIAVLVQKALAANKALFEAKEAMPNPKKEAAKEKWKAKVAEFNEQKRIAKEQAAAGKLV